MNGIDEWLNGQSSISEPTYLPVDIGPSPRGADDTARLLTVALFNGFCLLITAVANRGLLLTNELEGIHEAMTTPLDDPEMRDDELIACFRFSLEDVLAQARSITSAQRP